ncbi:MAG: hypothetical protein R3284_08560 [Rubricoccaceae bacterium]|nr:hypothetical protein [Rubricoccaceae bacterium]
MISTTPDDAHLSNNELGQRIARLERERRVGFAMIVALSITFAIGACAGLPTQYDEAEVPDILRVRGLVVVDEAGHERIVLGAPLPDAADTGPRVAPSTGIAINDAGGIERFAVGLLENGLFNMGFDGAPGTGDDRNRERINIGVTPDGRGYMRFLDRGTALASILYLNDEDDFALEIWEQTENGLQRGRLGLSGWELVE